METTDAEIRVPSLTSVFTPAPSCSSLSMVACIAFSCLANIGAENVRDTLSCYPESSFSTHTYHSTNSESSAVTVTRKLATPVFTYSPGLFCPLGMTTATSLEVLDAVYCCYSNFAYIGTNCVASFTEGTFLVDDSTIAFGPSQTDLFNSAASKYLGVNLRGPPTLGAIGTPIVLVGQRLLGNSSSISDSPTRSSSTPQASEGTTQVGDGLGKDRARSSTKLKVGVSVGVSVGILFLICICFLFIRRYRRKRLGQLGSADTPADKEKSAEYGDKPELEGSAANPGMFIKAELDALEIRAELEGSPGEEYDVDGVGVLKPELHGTPGVTGLLGVYVKKKAELEAPSKRNAVILTSSLQLDPAQGKLATNTTTEPAELES